MTKAGPALFAVACLAGCLAEPAFLRIDTLIPPPHAGEARELEFPARFERFVDDRSDRTAVGYRGTMSGAVPIAPDRDITEVFEVVAKRALDAKGVRDGESPLRLRGKVENATVGSLTGLSDTNLTAKVVLELTLVNAKTRAQLWSRSYNGQAVGSRHELTLAAAFQDLENSIARDDSILSIKAAYAAAGGRARSEASAPEPEEAFALSSDVDEGAPRGAAHPDDFALVIGVDKYQNLPAARYAERDASAFKTYAVRSLGVPEENAILLTGARATKTGIEKYVEEWLPKNVSPSSRVYVYFSGHGSPDPSNGTAYLLPWDGDASFLQTSAYPVPRLYDELSKLKAKEIVVALDSCFSGAGGRSVIAKNARPLVNVRETQVPAHVSVLTAASGGQIAGGLDDQGHGLFTYYLLKGLKGGAARDGHVSLADLHDFVSRGVERAARRQNREQTPQLKSSSADLLLY